MSSCTNVNCNSLFEATEFSVVVRTNTSEELCSALNKHECVYSFNLMEKSCLFALVWFDLGFGDFGCLAYTNLSFVNYQYPLLPDFVLTYYMCTNQSQVMYSELNKH